MPKFMQQLNPAMYRKLKRLAKARNITIQELLRSVVLPDYVMAEKQKTQKREPTKIEHPVHA